MKAQEHKRSSQPAATPQEQAKKRPADYLSRFAREQWEIDKELGILDWDGT